MIQSSWSKCVSRLVFVTVLVEQYAFKEGKNIKIHVSKSILMILAEYKTQWLN